MRIQAMDSHNTMNILVIVLMFYFVLTQLLHF